MKNCKFVINYNYLTHYSTSGFNTEKRTYGTTSRKSIIEDIKQQVEFQQGGQCFLIPFQLPKKENKDLEKE